jgi:beta-lactamase regulating signal transducer with metallopeptidase domain
MNIFIETLNRWAPDAVKVARAEFWQSSLLIAILLALDLGLRRRLRAAVRYALWLTVLLKLLLPPSLACPSGLGWWLSPSAPAAVTQPIPALVVSYGAAILPSPPPRTFQVMLPAARSAFSLESWLVIFSACTSAGLFFWMLGQWRRVIRETRNAAAVPQHLDALLQEACHTAGLRRSPRLRLTDHGVSPAVCGLFRSTILLPQTLVEQLNPQQLRAIVLHEAIHLRRGDLLVNCFQALFQILYWWHPLLWLANARIRHAREEAVDDAVMIALRDGSEVYAPTLLQVARLVLYRPLSSLGLVGILESRASLRWRIERLIEFRPPRRAGLTLSSAACIVGFGAVALPMGRAPAPAPAPQPESYSTRKAVSSSAVAPLDTRALNFDWYLGNSLMNGVTTGSQSMAATRSNDLPAAINPPGPFAKAHGQALSGDQLFTSPSVRPRTNDIERLDAGTPAMKAELSSMVEEARILYEMGKLAAAEEKLKAVLAQDPTNQAAYYYGNLIDEARFKQSQSQDVATPQFIPNYYAHTNFNESARRRMTLFSKLDKIRFDQVQFDNLPLAKVVRFLNDESRARDATRQGVNFILGSASQNRDSASPEVQKRDVSVVRIKILPALVDVRLADVLDAIVKVADKPIQYAIEDNGVVFSLKDYRSSGLYTRMIKVDAHTFEQGLERVFGRGSSRAGGSRDNQERAREFFDMLGVTLNSPQSLVFNEREGTLLIHATLQDLDRVEEAVQVLNIEPPQINLKVRFFEVPEEFAESFWKLLNTTNHLADQSSSLTAALTSPQWSVFQKSLQSNNKVRFVNEASITTLSGRQFAIQVTEIKSVVTNVNPRAIKRPGVSTRAADRGGVYLEAQIPFGPALEAVAFAVVSSNKWQIQLNATASMTEVSYYERTNQVRVYIDGKKSSVPFAMPHFTTRKAARYAVIDEGQTLILGSPIDGELDVTSPQSGARKRLLAIITPTIVDSAGNRLDSEGHVLSK